MSGEWVDEPYEQLAGWQLGLLKAAEINRVKERTEYALRGALPHDFVAGIAFQAGDVVRDAEGCMWWRWWDNSGWGHLLHFPGWHGDCDVDDAAPVEPLTLLLRDAQPVVTA